MKKPCLVVVPFPEELTRKIIEGCHLKGVKPKTNATGYIFVPEGREIMVLSKPEAWREVDRLANTGRISNNEAAIIREQIRKSVLTEEDLPIVVSKAIHETYEKNGECMVSVLSTATSRRKGASRPPISTSLNWSAKLAPRPVPHHRDRPFAF